MSGLSNRTSMTTSGRRNDRPTRDSDRGDSRLLSARSPDYRGRAAPGDVGSLEVADWTLRTVVCYKLEKDSRASRFYRVTNDT